MVDLSKTIGNSHQATDTMSQGYSVEHSNAIHKAANYVRSFADQNQISEEKAASLFAEASAGGGLGFAKGSVGGRSSTNSTDSLLLQKAQNIAQSEDFQEAYRYASQAAKNYSHNLSDEKSQRLAENVSGSYEQGMQQREEAAKSYSQAESYNQQAMFTKANSASINSNYNQQFVEWLSNQRADGTKGTIGRQGAAHIIANEPELVGAYANRFMEERDIIPATSVGSNAQSIRNSYDSEAAHRQHAVTRESLEDVRRKGHSEVAPHNLDRKELFSGTVSLQIDQHRDKIKSGETSIRSKQDETSSKFKDAEGRSVTVNSLKKVANEITDW